MKVSILGCGTMGTGIVQVLVCSDSVNKVFWWGRELSSLTDAFNRLKKNLNKQLKRDKETTNTLDDLMAKIVICEDFTHLNSCELIIEAIKENINDKKQLYENIYDFIGDNSLIATNTSSLSITDLSMSTPKPENFIGMHFFNPTPIMNLVELIRGLQTSDSIIAKAENIISLLGKTPVLVNDSPGFIVNRMLIPMVNEAVTILAENIASKEYIDQAMKLGANHPIGPLALADLIGVDVCLSIMETLFIETGDPKYLRKLKKVFIVIRVII